MTNSTQKMANYCWLIHSFLHTNSIYKEHIGYGKEAEVQQNRINKLIAEGADEADVRKQAS